MKAITAWFAAPQGYWSGGWLIWALAALGLEASNIALLVVTHHDNASLVWIGLACVVIAASHKRRKRSAS